MARFGLIPESLGNSLRRSARQALIVGLRELREALTESSFAAEVTAPAGPPAAPAVAPPSPAPAPVPAPTVRAAPVIPPLRPLAEDEEPGLFPPRRVERVLDDEARMALEARAVEVLRHVFDPEIPVNIYDLGLVYDVSANPAGAVAVTMTLTSPNCPAAQSLPGEVQERIGGLDGVTASSIDLVWEPPWGPERMSEEARLVLNM